MNLDTYLRTLDFGMTCFWIVLCVCVLCLRDEWGGEVEVLKSVLVGDDGLAVLKGVPADDVLAHACCPLTSTNHMEFSCDVIVFIPHLNSLY